MRPIIQSAILALCAAVTLQAQTPRTFTHADTLRGSNGAARSWWDAEFYDLHVRVNPSDSSIAGHNGITYRVLQPAAEMQIDLQAPLVMDSVVQGGKRLAWRRDGNAWFVTLMAPQPAGSRQTVTVYLPRQLRVRRHAPAAAARGPFHWATDSTGAPWVATSDEGPGASTWWPLKDFPADEPDSQRIAITVPDPMLDISNGRLRSTTHHGDGTTTFEWFVSNPINSYDVAINASAALRAGARHRGRHGRPADRRVLAAGAAPRRGGGADAAGQGRCWPASSTGSGPIPGTPTGTS